MHSPSVRAKSNSPRNASGGVTRATTCSALGNRATPFTCLLSRNTSLRMYPALANSAPILAELGRHSVRTIKSAPMLINQSASPRWRAPPPWRMFRQTTLVNDLPLATTRGSRTPLAGHQLSDASLAFLHPDPPFPTSSFKFSFRRRQRLPAQKICRRKQT